MKKSLLSILAILLTASVAMGQACEPDPQFTDPGLFPLPESEGGEGLPVGCEDDPYEVVMTVVVPDSANVGGFSVPIDRIELVSIDGMPTDFTAACEPSDHSFPGGSNGCAIISGPAGTAPMTYPITINVQIFVFGAPIDSSFSGYELEILPSGACIDGIDDNFGSTFELSQNKPNPFYSETTIEFDAPVASTYEFIVFNVLGKVVHKEEINARGGLNTINFSAEDLDGGVYLYMLDNGQHRMSRKMTVDK